MDKAIDFIKKYSIIIFVIIGLFILGVLWLMAKVIVGHSYSSEKLILEEVPKIVEGTEEIIEDTASLGEVDYIGRKIEVVENLDSDYYKKRVEFLSTINERDVSEEFILPRSYYYGDYKTYYKEDEKIFLHNYREIIDILGLLDSIGLSDYVEQLEIDIPEYTSEDVCKAYSTQDIESDLSTITSVQEALLIGVIQDRFYVYADSTIDLNECSKFVIIDMSTTVSYIDEGVVSSVLKRLGQTDSFILFPSRCINIQLENKTFYITRGY